MLVSIYDIISLIKNVKFFTNENSLNSSKRRIMINNSNSLRFVVKIPEKLAPEQAAPLLCAGVTAYSPLRKFCRSRPGLKGGILGLGGVGHVGVQIAKAMGHHVTVISSSDRKREEALEHLGADAFLVSSDGAQMGGAQESLDYILDTIPAVHSLEPYLSPLKVDGKLLLVGVAPKPLQFDPVV